MKALKFLNLIRKIAGAVSKMVPVILWRKEWRWNVLVYDDNFQIISKNGKRKNSQ